MPMRRSALSQRLLAGTFGLARDRRGMAAVEYGLIMASIVAAAAVALPVLQNQLANVAQDTETNYLQAGLPNLPDSVTDLINQPTPPGNQGTDQQTGVPGPSDPVNQDNPQGSRRYYDDENYVRGDPPDSGTDPDPPDPVDPNPTDPPDPTDPPGGGGVALAPFLEDFSTADGSQADPIEGLATVSTADGFTLNDSTDSIEPPNLGQVSSGETPGSVVFEEVSISGLTNPRVTLNVQTEGGSGFDGRSSSSAEYLDILVSYDGGNTYQTIASYEGNDDVMTFDSSEVDVPSGTGPSITSSPTSISFDLDPLEDTAIIRIDGRTSTNSESFVINSVGFSDSTEVFAEDFNSVSTVSASSAVASSNNFSVNSNAAQTSNSDAAIVFEPIDISNYQTVTASIDVDVDNINQFENGGSAGDYFDVYAVMDDGSEVLLDRFEVQGDSNREFVGSISNQTFDSSPTTLSYDLSGLGGADSSAQLVVRTRSTASGEIFRVDNYEVTGTLGVGV